jgi:transposase
MHFEHRAGEKLFLDFAGDTVPIWDQKTGEVDFQAQLFVAVMGASSYIFAKAFANQKAESWIAGGTAAFKYMGAVPMCVVPDNPKAVVIKPSKYDPVFNESYLEWARHYEVTILPARPRKPRDKAAVEGGVLIVERQILARLRHVKFFSLYELNGAIYDLLEELNAKPFQAREGTRSSVFETLDKPAMRPLPPTAYEYGEWKRLKVQMNYHVRVEDAYYSVPYDLVGQTLDVRVTRTTVEIFAAGVRIVSHRRCERRGQYQTVFEHMPSSHQAQASWTPARILAWAETIGPNTQVVCETIMSGRHYPEQGFNQCRAIFNLASKIYDKDRVEAACARAIAIHSPLYKSVVSILKNGLDAHELTPPASPPPIEHANIRGPEYYQELLTRDQENATC